MLRTLMWVILSAAIPPVVQPPSEGDQPIIIYDGPPRCVGSAGSLPSPPFGPVHTIRGLLTLSSSGERFWETRLPPRGHSLDYPSSLSAAAVRGTDFLRFKLQYIQSYTDWSDATFAIEFVGQREEFPESYVRTVMACRPEFNIGWRARQPSYRFLSISHVTRCSTVPRCRPAGDRMILPEERLGPRQEYSGVVINVNGTPYFLTDPGSTSPLIDRPDRIPIVEARWGMFDSFDDALRENAHISLFAVRFIGRRSSEYRSYPRPGPPFLAGKIVVDRLMEFRRCPPDINLCHASGTRQIERR